MKKGLIALLVVLAMVITVSVFSVSAETEATTPDYTLSFDDDGTATAYCPHCSETVTFTAWDGTNGKEYGTDIHRYVTANTEITSQLGLYSMVLHLNGNTVQRTNQGAPIAIQAGAEVYILDNPANEGGILNRNTEGALNTWGGYGGIFSVNTASTLNIYGGTYTASETDSTTTSTYRLSAGGVIGINNSSAVVNMYGGVLEGTINYDSAADSLGGAVGIKNGTFNMYGGTIQNSSAKNGGAFHVNGAATVNIYGGEIENCSATNTGGVAWLSGANSKFVMSGGTISKCYAKSGGALYIQYMSDQNVISGGTIDSCYTTGGHGGAIYLSGTAPSITVTGDAEIKNCYVGDETKYYGGAVALIGSSTSACTGSFVLDGEAKITNCKALWGGGIYLTYCTNGVTINGGTISGCEATERGGSVAMAGSTSTATLNITGGTITGGFCQDTVGGGNIYAEGKTTINISGGTISNGYVWDGETAPTPKYDDTDTSKVIGYSNWVAGSGGNINIRTNVMLNITGGTISGGSAKNGGNINLYGNVEDQEWTGGTITGGIAENGGNVYLYGTSADYGSLVLNGVTISAGSAKNRGNLHAQSYCSVTMKSGTITGGKATAIGGNVGFGTNTASFTMEGGTISDGTAGTYGGNIEITTVASEFTMTGGTISDGSAVDGGNIAAIVGIVNMSDGTITGGNATNGGNVYVGAKGQFTLSGGTITLGTAKYAANVKIVGSAADALGLFTMTGGTISKGVASSNYGGVLVAAFGKLVMTDGTIDGNKSVYSGGNVAVNSGGDPCYLDITGGTISNGVCTKGAGGNLYTTKGSVVTIKNCTFTGGEVGSGSTTTAYNGGSMSIAAGAVTFEDCTISGGKATGLGGNVYNSIAGTTFTNCTISGGTAGTSGSTLTAGGGNIYVNKAAEFDNCTFTDGKVYSGCGGNIYVNAASTFNECEISSGTSIGHTVDSSTTIAGYGGNIYNAIAGTTFTSCEIKNGTSGEEGTYKGYSRGGNIYTAKDLTLTTCVIRDGKSYGTIGGGNIQIEGGTISINACTITGGYSYKNGGNIGLHGAPVVTITGDSYIAGGVANTGWGGNIGMNQLNNANAITLTIEGDTTIDGTDARCQAGTNYGNNLGISKYSEVYIRGNAVIKNGKHTQGGLSDDNRPSIAVEKPLTPEKSTVSYQPTVYVGGNATVDHIFLRGTSADTLANYVVIEADFTGLISDIDTNYSTYNGNLSVGADLYTETVTDESAGTSTTYYAVIAADGYDNTGTVRVVDNSSTSKLTYYTEGKFVIAGITGFTTLTDAEGETYTFERGFDTLDAVVDAGYAYAKLYAGGDYELSAKTDGFPIDLNNQVVRFITKVGDVDYTLAPMDWRTNSAVTAKYTQLTVDTDANVQIKVVNPIDGKQYFNVKGDHLVASNGLIDSYIAEGAEAETKTFWTSNRVKVEMTKVSIKPAKAGIYYTTSIATNANAAACLVDYGTAVSVVPGVVIDENFLDTAGVLYTAITVADEDKSANYSNTALSALITDIIKEGDTADVIDENTTNSEKTITANSYVLFTYGETDYVFMADEASALTFQEIMAKLDAKYPDMGDKQSVALDFYNDYAATFSTWTDLLPNLKAAAEAAAAA